MDYVIKIPAMTNDKQKGRMSCWKHHRWSTWSSWIYQAKRLTGNITAARDPGETPALTTEYEYSESSWDEHHGKRLCSVSELNDAAKRQRPDDGEDEDAAQAPR